MSAVDPYPRPHERRGILSTIVRGVVSVVTGAIALVVLLIALVLLF